MSDDEFIPDEETAPTSPVKKVTKEKSTEKRLKNILNQAEAYTKKILGTKTKGRRVKKASAKTIQKGKSRRHCNDSNEDINSNEEENNCEKDDFLLLNQPSILKHELRNYQLNGLNWLISLYHHKASGILADEMGLGKTIQTISLLAFLKEYKKITKYFLVIAPKSCIPNWIKEFKEWLPCMKVVNLIPKKAKREEIIRNDLQPDMFNICVTTYEGVRICLDHLQKFDWEYLIVDEAHKMKNEASQLSKKLRMLKSNYRLLLTGTPLQNNLHELWALLNFLMPKIFSSSDDFDELFNVTKKCDDEELVEQRNELMIKQLHLIMRPFLLRRMKKDTDCDLPPKTEFHIKVGLTEIQKKIYRELLTNSAIEKGSTVSHYKNLVIQLRKVCNHPYLFNGIEDPAEEEFGEHLVQVCGKMRFLDQLLKKTKADGNQCLIFSNFTTQLNILEDYCLMREFQYCRLDGTTDLDDRERQIDEFTKKDSEYFVFLISTRAGGLGLNLMSANVVVLYDSDWNPQIDLQAMDRAHRIGQTKPVQVFRLITQSTMEEKMIEKQTMKLKLDSMIIQKGGQQKTNISKEDLANIVNYGADKIFKAGDDITSDDIETIIAKGKESAEKLAEESDNLIKKKFDMKNFEINSLNFWEFEDENYLQKRKEIELKLIADNVVKILDEKKKEGRREKLKKMKNLNEDALCPELASKDKDKPVDNRREFIDLPDWRFYKEIIRLRDLINKEENSKNDPKFELSLDEKAEKDMILKESFHNWSYREYNRLLEALDFCLPDETKRISEFIETKSPEEVKPYIETLLRNYNNLTDCQLIRSTLNTTKKMLEYKWGESSKNPPCGPSLYPTILPFCTQKSKLYSKESDITLLKLTHSLGYGNWKLIKKSLKKTKSRFNHCLLSRTEPELKKRVDLIIKAVDKEAKENLHTVKSELVKDILKMKEIWEKAQIEQSDDEEEEEGLYCGKKRERPQNGFSKNKRTRH